MYVQTKSLKSVPIMSLKDIPELHEPCFPIWDNGAQDLEHITLCEVTCNGILSGQLWVMPGWIRQ